MGILRHTPDCTPAKTVLENQLNPRPSIYKYQSLDLENQKSLTSLDSNLKGL